MTVQPWPHGRQSGATLLEVMVAILLLSLGFLAVASVHASAFKYGKMSEFHSSALNLGSSVIDRMRANSQGAAADAYLSADASYPAKATSAAADCTNPASSCTPAQVAQSDLSDLLRQAGLDLPGGDIYVKQNTSVTGATAYEIWVRWRDPQDNGASATGNIAAACPGSDPKTADLSCVLVTAIF